MTRKKSCTTVFIELFCVVCAFLAYTSGSSKGLKSFKATMGNDDNAGTDDNVKVQLSGGVNDGTCTTGTIYYGGVHNSWSKGDTEDYVKAKNQDFGTCATFEANRSATGFTIKKDGNDGLELVKMEFVIGDETYIWEGKRWWDPPDHPQEPLETAYCTSGNCLPKIVGEGPGASIAAVIVLLLLAAIVFIVYKRWKSRERDEDYEVSYTVIVEPSNLVVKKDEHIRKSIKALADNKTALKEEFKRIEKYAQEVIKNNNTVEVANKIENKDHNRYVDQVPYDLNMVKLQTPVGDPPGIYINASTISFPMMDQTFIAVQAPRENSFPAFWQLVLENQVHTILMISGLVEGGKEKANQYWPDMANKDMQIEDIKIRYESHSFPGTYYHRKLVVMDGQGRERTVNHIQTTAWLDMKAPKDTKVLLDLVYKAEELAEEKRGPIVVHCSAGVGRTGTFIALYKLADDYHNNRVKELELYSTVVAMRTQRMKMVQKSAQYVYIAKCLHHYISAQTSEYQLA